MIEEYVGQRPKVEQQTCWEGEVAEPLKQSSVMVESKKATSESKAKGKSNTGQPLNRARQIKALGPDARNIIRSFHIFYEGGKEFRGATPAKSLGEAAENLEARSNANTYPEKLAWSKTALSNACTRVAEHFGLKRSADLFIYNGEGTSFAGLSEIGESVWERVRNYLLLEEIIQEKD